MQLTNNQKKFLRSLAHNINPVVMLGVKGLSESVQDEIISSLKKHEILKIKIRVEKELKQQIIDEIIKITKANLVQVIGNVLVIYKAFDEPQVILPRS
jgi:RNA-binding protein